MDDTQKNGRAPVESTAVSTSSSSNYATPLRTAARATDIAIRLTQTHQSHHTHHIWEVAHG